MFARLCKVINAEHLMTDPLYSRGGPRLKNRARLNAEIEAITRTRKSAEWIELLNAALAKRTDGAAHS